MSSYGKSPRQKHNQSKKAVLTESGIFYQKASSDYNHISVIAFYTE